MSLRLETPDLAGNRFRLGDWLVEPSLNRLSKGETTVQLELKVMDVLVCLVERAGEVVTRQEIVDRVWATEFISDNTLTHAVTELRNAMGDDARNPSFIETIHRRGYRLIAAVEPSVPDEPAVSKVARFPVPERPDERSPYPGLAAFTEEDAEFFFGREDEVAKMWRKLTSRRLLSVIGPSGVGKSSFLRAGVIPSRPEGWGVIICQPGEAPLPALARALVPIFAGDIEATTQLVDISDGDRAVAVVSRWRDRHKQSLLIVDQFEELFTLNPTETQERFAATLRRLVDDADVHVLLSLRDDFLHRCHEQRSLAPVFEDLTPIGQPDTEALVNALIEPARRLGFEFEDADLPNEMASEVEGERSALPLLAFAVARLWDERETESRTLTRGAYDEIGGVGGALGQHAETTLKSIGDERLPIVREIFRNLVTAEGTRAVREWDELLSVFDASNVGRVGIKPAPTKETTLEKPTVGAGSTPARAAAEEVLRRLVDARLLTSFEEEEVDGGGRRRVEVVHETLLASWPRLVRWQTQDADAAQLRDQLRQAAKTWDEHGRTDDTLWTGAAYREFAVWREAYPGGLTELEEAFAAAMTSLATRRRRRRRIAVTTVIIALLTGLAVVGTFWRRSVLETRRAEAAKLLALAEVQIDEGPTEALAYATASLEQADTVEARLFAVRALWEGPPVRVLDHLQYDEGQLVEPTFSPDGRWLAVGGLINEHVPVYGDHGGPPILLGGHAVTAQGWVMCGWTAGGHLVTGHLIEGRARVWSIPDGRLLRTICFGEKAWWQVGGSYLFAEVMLPMGNDQSRFYDLKKWLLPNGESEDLGRIEIPKGASTSYFDPGGKAWIYTRGNEVIARSLPIGAEDRSWVVAAHANDGARLGVTRRPVGVYSSDSGGEIFLWPTADGIRVPGRHLRPTQHAVGPLRPDLSGKWAVSDFWADPNHLQVWALEGLRDSRPWKMRRASKEISYADIQPGGAWVAAVGREGEIEFWPLSAPLPLVVDGWMVHGFSRDGRFLFAEGRAGGRGTRVGLLPVPSNTQDEVIELMFPRPSSATHMVYLDPEGRRSLAMGYGHNTYLFSVDGDEPRNLFGFPAGELSLAGGFSPSGRLVAAATVVPEDTATLRVWDLLTDEVQVFEQPQDPEGWEGKFTTFLSFIDEGTLFTSGANGLLRWDLQSGSFDTILRAPPDGQIAMSVSGDRKKMLTHGIDQSWSRIRGPVQFHDLETGEIRDLQVPGEGWVGLSWDGSVWAAGDRDGLLWVGKTAGGEPHALFCGRDSAISVGFPHMDPDSRWVAFSDGGKGSRLWPMPDLDKPPLHTLPHDELIAKLHSLTNLRVVRDEESSTGWKVEIGPFPGWAEVAEW